MVVFEVIKYAISNGELQLSARRGIITFLPKKDRDTIFLKNW